MWGTGVVFRGKNEMLLVNTGRNAMKIRTILRNMKLPVIETQVTLLFSQRYKVVKSFVLVGKLPIL